MPARRRHLLVLWMRDAPAELRVENLQLSRCRGEHDDQLALLGVSQRKETVYLSPWGNQREQQSYLDPSILQHE